MLLPVYVYFQVVGMEEIDETALLMFWMATLAYDLTLDDLDLGQLQITSSATGHETHPPAHDQLVCHATVVPL